MIASKKCLKQNAKLLQDYRIRKTSGTVLPVSSSITSMFVALYREQSADPIFTAAEGLVTIDFLEVACRLLLNPTRYTESPRRRAGSVGKQFQKQQQIILQIRQHLSYAFQESVALLEIFMPVENIDNFQYLSYFFIL